MATERTVDPGGSSRRPPLGAEGTCDLCGGLTYEVRCKVVCRRCGFTRDCSDP